MFNKKSEVININIRYIDYRAKKNYQGQKGIYKKTKQL